MSGDSPGVVMVGAFPPPVLGMAIVNAHAYESIRSVCRRVMVVDVAAESLDRSWLARVGRFPKVVRGLIRLLFSRSRRGGALYISISGGFGKLYDVMFVVGARLRGMRVYLHHHSYAYLDRKQWLGSALTLAAGQDSVHITQCTKMAKQLRELYPTATRVLPISNAAFLTDAMAAKRQIREVLKTIAFVSNISEEKGIFLFLDLVSECEKCGLPIQAKLAGPFQDRKVERAVRERLGELKNIEYVGPKYGDAKEVFLSSIDVLVFPTIYRNETEGIVNYDAMRHCVPIIAYGRGCVPEVIGGRAGLIVDPSTPFVPAGMRQLKEWLDYPTLYKDASHSAKKRFAAACTENRQGWERLVQEMTNVEQ